MPILRRRRNEVVAAAAAATRRRAASATSCGRIEEARSRWKREQRWNSHAQILAQLRLIVAEAFRHRSQLFRHLLERRRDEYSIIYFANTVIWQGESKCETFSFAPFVQITLLVVIRISYGQLA